MRHRRERGSASWLPQRDAADFLAMRQHDDRRARRQRQRRGGEFRDERVERLNGVRTDFDEKAVVAGDGVCLHDLITLEDDVESLLLFCIELALTTRGDEGGDGAPEG